ncbi:hypothetical protein BJ508DRAFT_414425 [Ascobolus immersus RN42]|uniref:Uncharacterized protein n=1 Tax=Ascobolus immersus RN42 TaxID=1160509 RepID=A0A3N4ICS7_ASCIM|nr:hypothetical protein BJ508DRAFT_414425 [Ascobolus immersus RN42]
MGTTFKSLPLDIHYSLSQYLSSFSFTALARTNHHFRTIYEPLLYCRAAQAVRAFLLSNRTPFSPSKNVLLFYEFEKIRNYLGHLATLNAIRHFFDALGPDDEDDFALMVLADVSSVHNLSGGTRYDVIEQVLIPRVLPRQSTESAEMHWGRILWVAMIEEDNIELLRFLARKGLDITQPFYINKVRLLPLNEVAVQGSPEMLKFLLEMGADLNGIDHLNMTPLSRLAAETDGVEKSNIDRIYRKTQALVLAGAHPGGPTATKHPLAELWMNFLMRGAHWQNHGSVGEWFRT